MLIDEVNKHYTGILFDGYPEQFQAEALDDFLETIGSKVAATVALEADDEILIQRLLERKTSGRIDDQDEEKKKSLPRIQRKNSSVNGVLQQSKKVLRRKWNRDNPGNLNV
jgi:adenylate kinase family enzyme